MIGIGAGGIIHYLIYNHVRPNQLEAKKKNKKH
jgi:hypothetical protein